MSLKLLFFLPVFLFLPALARAQATNEYERGVMVGYAYAKTHFLQLGILHGQHYGNRQVPSYGFGEGIELGVLDHEVTLGLKGFAEYHPFQVLAARMNALVYLREDRLDFRLMPEVGFTAMGRATLLYGYGKSVAGREMPGIAEHRVSLTVTFFTGD
ncbi:hypothetical protein GU926_11710 [Nibribacter ruber]|uniref:Outer membrane beta-barrel protein n=1 Tax=Nibribacter ruber TaxID=2698458 RepID=A0A6P1NYD7_9BACT|nr:hypothetical protein [Nibribacter ruber]QHL88060.1 hypothetical protein GU926_11710 [Nibribacter ruber]